MRVSVLTASLRPAEMSFLFSITSRALRLGFGVFVMRIRSCYITGFLSVQLLTTFIYLLLCVSSLFNCYLIVYYCSVLLPLNVYEINDCRQRMWLSNNKSNKEGAPLNAQLSFD